jgi:hypothetical protein
MRLVIEKRAFRYVQGEPQRSRREESMIIYSITVSAMLRCGGEGAISLAHTVLVTFLLDLCIPLPHLSTVSQT